MRTGEALARTGPRPRAALDRGAGQVRGLLGGPRRRPLHAAAWWIWAGALAATAATTTNPVLLALVFAVSALVVVARRPDSPFARSFGTLVRIGLVVIAIRVIVQVLFGIRLPGHRVFSVPSVALPSWMAGVSVGGPVTIEEVVAAACQGLRLAVVLSCVGAANALASPYRLLRSVPAGLYEVAVAVTVAVSFTPQVVASVSRVRDARRLRGRRVTGLRGLRGIAVPVLESALERSVALAASMDSRGFGRRALSGRRQALSSAATLAGLVGLAIGVFAVLDASSGGAAGIVFIALGVLLVVAGLAASSTGSRTRYRPDRFGAREWVVAASGLVGLVTLGVLGHFDPAVLTQQTYPLALPAVPLLGVVALLCGAAPAVVAPRPVQGAGR